MSIVSARTRKTAHSAVPMKKLDSMESDVESDEDDKGDEMEKGESEKDKLDKDETESPPVTKKTKVHTY